MPSAGPCKIESIKKIRGRKDWFYCNLNNGSYIEVSGSMLLYFELHEGKTLNRDELSDIRKKSEDSLAKFKALRLLSYRARSEKELARKLKEKGVRFTAAKKAVGDMKDLNLIDDEDFSLRFTRDLLRRKPAGRFLLQSELKKKGVAEQVIDRVLDQVFEEFNETELAHDCMVQWIKRHPRVSEFEQRNKLSQYLYQRGFTWAIIEEVLGDERAS